MLILMMLMVSMLASSVVDCGLEPTRMLILMMLMVRRARLECGRSWVRDNEDADSHDANGKRARLECGRSWVRDNEDADSHDANG